VTISFERTVELLHRSSARMMRTLEKPRDAVFWCFMQREAEIHRDRANEIIEECERHKEEKKG